MTSTFTIKSLLINGNDQIHQVDIFFDTNKNTASNYDLKMEAIIENMRTRYQCSNFSSNVAMGIYPNNTFCYIFYQSESPENKFNKIATHIANTSYNNYTKSLTKCYGECYILLINDNNDLFDLGADMFVNIFNKVLTSTGIEERDYSQRLFKVPFSSKCYLHNDYALYIQRKPK